jgi:hypothetical protein
MALQQHNNGRQKEGCSSDYSEEESSGAAEQPPIDLIEEVAFSEEDSAAAAAAEQPIDSIDGIALLPDSRMQQSIRDFHLDTQNKLVTKLKASKDRLDEARQEVFDALGQHKKISEQLMVIQKTIGDTAVFSDEKDELYMAQFLRQYQKSNQYALNAAFVSVLEDFKAGSEVTQNLNIRRIDLRNVLRKWEMSLNVTEIKLGKRVASDSPNKKRTVASI